PPPAAPPLLDVPRPALGTGAGRGIGRGLALGLAAHGWSLALVGRTEERLQEVAAEIVTRGESPTEPVVAAADLTDHAAARAAVAQVEAAFDDLGGIGLLVNNAGVIEQREVSLVEDDLEDTWRVIEANVRGPLAVTRAVLPGMLARGGGRVVNINSGAAHREYSTYTGYNISKGALARLTTGLDSQYRDSGIRAFDLAPGVVATDMTAAMPAHADRTEWTPVEASVELLRAIGAGELDALSGRFFRAGADTVEGLVAHTYEVLVNDARRLRLVTWGSDDPM
uniref:SDR family NAD(P)-dependent oxidoreductase n=1 Tax=Actinotalea sp. C106 TaxID=2908644 RepID=UPI0027E19F43